MSRFADSNDLDPRHEWYPAPASKSDTENGLPLVGPAAVEARVAEACVGCGECPPMPFMAVELVRGPICAQCAHKAFRALVVDGLVIDKRSRVTIENGIVRISTEGA
jgi:hypothetical protein